MLHWIDFFGRVKDKAGDMERILKEKDKHGNTLTFILLNCLCVSVHCNYVFCTHHTLDLPYCEV